jgi:hypothetical protein
MLKLTQTGVVTNDDGTFALKLPDSLIGKSVTLLVTSIGYTNRTVAVSSAEQSLIVRMEPLDSELLGEVVFAGAICVKPTFWGRIKNWLVFWK